MQYDQLKQNDTVTVEYLGRNYAGRVQSTTYHVRTFDVEFSIETGQTFVQAFSKKTGKFVNVRGLGSDEALKTARIVATAAAIDGLQAAEPVNLGVVLAKRVAETGGPIEFATLAAFVKYARVIVGDRFATEAEAAVLISDRAHGWDVVKGYVANHWIELGDLTDDEADDIGIPRRSARVVGVIEPSEIDILNHYRPSDLIELAFRAMVDRMPTLIESDITGKFENATETWRAAAAQTELRGMFDNAAVKFINAATDTDIKNGLQGLLDALTKWREALKESARISFHNRSAATLDRLDARRADATVKNCETEIEKIAFRLESFNPERVGDIMELLDPAGDPESSVRDRLLEVGTLNGRYGRATSAIVGCKGIPVEVRADVAKAAEAARYRPTTTIEGDNGNGVETAITTFSNAAVDDLTESGK